MRVLLILLLGFALSACAGSATQTTTTTSSGPQGTTQTTETTQCSRSAGMPLPPGCSDPPDYNYSYSTNVFVGRRTYYSPSRVYSGHPRYYPRDWGYGGYYTTRDSSGRWVQRQYVPRLRDDGTEENENEFLEKVEERIREHFQGS